MQCQHIILMGMELVAPMYRSWHALFCSAFSRAAPYATDGLRIAHKWTIRGSDASVMLPHVLLVAGVVAVNRSLGSCKSTGKGMSFCINARIDRVNRLLQNCLHPHLLR